jgi:hypothetical protein
MGLGKIIYHIYYRPLAGLNHIKRLGIINYLVTGNRKRQMVSAAKFLKEINKSDLPEHAIYILTGKKYWYQTAFCLYSLQKVSESIQFNAILVDDGSFDDRLIRQIKSQFPNIKLQLADETEKRLKEYLPTNRYPALRKKRENYPHIRKLIDIHAGQAGWKVVLDSDMLFFNKPKVLEGWLKNPEIPIFLQDPYYAYYYSAGLMTNLAGKVVPLYLNVGMVGLQSESLDWDKLESWIVELEAREGQNYLLEQALSAMIVAGKPILIAPKDDYIVLPNKQETQKPSAVLHHYVAESKEWYFKNAWRAILSND